MNPPKQTPAQKYVGKLVRVKCEAKAVAHYDAGPTAPERVAIAIGGIVTIVPVVNVEVVG